jgi:hypothetical protein
LKDDACNGSLQDLQLRLVHGLRLLFETVPYILQYFQENEKVFSQSFSGLGDTI